MANRQYTGVEFDRWIGAVLVHHVEYIDEYGSVRYVKSDVATDPSREVKTPATGPVDVGAGGGQPVQPKPATPGAPTGSSAPPSGAGGKVGGAAAGGGYPQAAGGTVVSMPGWQQVGAPLTTASVHGRQYSEQGDASYGQGAGVYEVSEYRNPDGSVGWVRRLVPSTQATTTDKVEPKVEPVAAGGATTFQGYPAQPMGGPDPIGNESYVTAGVQKGAQWTYDRIQEGNALGLDTTGWWEMHPQAISDNINNAKQRIGSTGTMTPGASVEALGKAAGTATGSTGAGDSDISRLINMWQAYLDLETRRVNEESTQGQFGRELAGTQYLSSLANNPLNYGAYMTLGRSSEGSNFLQSLAGGRPVGYVPSGGPTSLNAIGQAGEGGITGGGPFGMDMRPFVERYQRAGGLDWQNFAKGTPDEQSAFASLLPAFIGISQADFFERERRASLPENTGFGRTARQVSL